MRYSLLWATRKPLWKPKSRKPSPASKLTEVYIYHVPTIVSWHLVSMQQVLIVCECLSVGSKKTVINIFQLTSLMPGLIVCTWVLGIWFKNKKSMNPDFLSYHPKESFDKLWMEQEVGQLKRYLCPQLGGYYLGMDPCTFSHRQMNNTSFVLGNPNQLCRRLEHKSHRWPYLGSTLLLSLQESNIQIQIHIFWEFQFSSHSKGE